MNTSRRKFLQAGAIGAAAAIMPQLTFSSSDVESKAAVSQDLKSDPTVSKRTGPHGEGLPVTMAGYEYNRVRGLIDGSVNVKGCSTKFEVTGIGPLNNHAFFGPQTRDITDIKVFMLEQIEE